jgi:hypothetical protein
MGSLIRAEAVLEVLLVKSHVFLVWGREQNVAPLKREGEIGGG